MNQFEIGIENYENLHNAKLWRSAGLPITVRAECAPVIGNPAGRHNAHYRNKICCNTAQYGNKRVKNHVCCNIGQYCNKFCYDNDTDSNRFCSIETETGFIWRNTELWEYFGYFWLDISYDNVSADFILLKAAGFFTVCCWNSFQIFSIEIELDDPAKIFKTILVTRWVRFYTAFCAVAIITLSSRFDIWYNWSLKVSWKDFAAKSFFNTKIVNNQFLKFHIWRS